MLPSTQNISCSSSSSNNSILLACAAEAALAQLKTVAWNLLYCQIKNGVVWKTKHA